MSEKVFTIVVTYNSLKNDWIKKCLNSLKESYCPSQIIVVDNHSSDNTVSYIKNNHPDVELIETNKNLGFGKANNIGIKKVIEKSADYVFLLNHDAWIEPNTIEELVKIAKKNPKYGIISPIHLNGSGDKLDRYFSYYMSYDKNNNFYSDYILNNKSKEIYEVPFINAAAWLLPRKTIEIIGGFDPIFKHYGEDDNYCQRVLYHGYKIGVVSKSVIYHDRENRTQNSILPFSSQYFKNYKKALSVKYANINLEATINYRRYEKIITIKKLIRSILRFKFKNSIAYYKLYTKLNSLFNQIEKSRLLNKKQGATYL